MIKKKANSHKRKLNKKTGEHAGTRKPLKKSLDIPNLWPYKQHLLAKVLESKNGGDGVSVMNTNSMDVDATTTEEGEEYTHTKAVSPPQNSNYLGEMNRLIEECDVLIQVLDVRDPLGCRCAEIERRITSHPGRKRLVLVLNKIDLVPAAVVTQWLDYLRQEFPTIAFKASTQNQKSRMGQSSSSSFTGTSSALGANTLIQLLKNYSRSRKMKKAITVGVFGIPNTGKSSLINSLKRSRAVGVGATPGFTKSLQEVHLDKKVKLIDSPGIIMATGTDGTPTGDSALALRNSVRLEKLDDPTGAVHTLVGKCPQEELVAVYNIPKFNNPDEFILHVAFKKGKLKKGGVADLEGAAISILQDWNSGVIPFYTVPPTVRTPKNRSVDVEETAPMLVSSLGEEFDVEALLNGNSNEVASMVVDEGDSSRQYTNMGVSTIQSYGIDASELTTPVSTTTTTSRPDEEDLLNPRTNQSRAKKVKQDRKDRKRMAASLGEDAIETEEEAYDFTQHEW